MNKRQVREISKVDNQEWVSQKTRNGLETLGHKIHDEIGGFGGYQAIMQKNGLYFGASESRKDGQASGY